MIEGVLADHIAHISTQTIKAIKEGLNDAIDSLDWKYEKSKIVLYDYTGTTYSEKSLESILMEATDAGISCGYACSSDAEIELHDCDNYIRDLKELITSIEERKAILQRFVDE